MKIIRERSVGDMIKEVGQEVRLNSKRFSGFPKGVNKEEEYSWFYILCVQGKAGEKVRIIVNDDRESTPLTRDNSLVFTSSDQWQWRQLQQPVWTDHGGLRQRYEIALSSDRPLYISNTMFFEYRPARQWLDSFVNKHSRDCERQVIGQSVNKNPLEIVTFPATGETRGRILVTTGCHPAEPDLICAQEIMSYLVSPLSAAVRQHYAIDVMPMQNPDGYALKSCLNAQGINLYWNFRYGDRQHCPEAYYLWQYVQQNPPVLYLDFHAYVHQYHRHPMPYLQSRACYVGHEAKRLVRRADRFLIKASNGYYRIGTVSMWPTALSTLVTSHFNTLAYTKYHINLYEGEAKSRRRALRLFRGVTNLLLKQKVRAALILRPPFGEVTPDYTDTWVWRRVYRLLSFGQQVIVYFKSYYRYWRWRNRPALY